MSGAKKVDKKVKEYLRRAQRMIRKFDDRHFQAYEPYLYNLYIVEIAKMIQKEERLKETHKITENLELLTKVCAKANGLTIVKIK